jgi:ATP-binding cassette subfamily D (ALD) protein 3
LSLFLVPIFSSLDKACNLGGSERIDNADQRVTADIKDFSDEIASLYASLLKPLLDVVLFTYKLKTLLGWQGPAAMHSYFVLSGFIKKKIMPNLGRLVARESELEGFYRSAHNRLITNSEEIAFYDGSKKEKVRERAEGGAEISRERGRGESEPDLD